MQALEDLRALGTPRAWLPTGGALDGSPRELKKLAEKLSIRGHRGAQPRKPRFGLEEARSVWDRFLANGDSTDLTARALAVLCWDEDVACSEAFLSLLTTRVSSRASSPKRRMLRALLWVYHRRFDKPPSALEKLLRGWLRLYAGSNASLRAVSAAVDLVLGSDAPQHAALAIAEHGGTATSLLKQFQLNHDPRTPYERSVAGMVLGRWLREIAKESDPERITAILDDHIKVDRQLLDPGGFTNLAKRMVGVGQADRSGHVREGIKTFLLTENELGDPRRHPTRWTNKGLTAEADVVRSWLSEEDLRFFFELIMDPRTDRHGRRDFWLRYVHRVRTSRVAIGQTHAYRHSFKLRELSKRGRTFGKLTDVDVSAFVMDFGDVIVVEFSEVGNACYVYDARDFRRFVPDVNRDAFWLGQLKEKRASPARLRHDSSGNWTYVARDLLARLGIRD